MIVLVGLLDVLKVKELILKNRIVMPPMASGLATAKGAVTAGLVEQYSRCAKELGLLKIGRAHV